MAAAAWGGWWVTAAVSLLRVRMRYATNQLHDISSPRPPRSSQRDGCPKIINLGQARTDMFYERKKYGFIKNG